MQPLVYSGENPNPFHTMLWERFWDYANDPAFAAEQGVRAIHGEASFIEARPGKTYRVELRSSGGLSIKAEQSASGNGFRPCGGHRVERVPRERGQ